MNNEALIFEIAKYKKPVIFSTGMAYLREIKRTVSILKNYKRFKMFQRMNVPIQIDEVRYTQIQSLLQREKPTPNPTQTIPSPRVTDYM